MGKGGMERKNVMREAKKVRMVKELVDISKNMNL